MQTTSRAWLPLALLLILGPAAVLGVLAAPSGATGAATTRRETFDRDPGWDGHNCRSTTPEPRVLRQDFGYRRSQRDGRAVGEVGGFVSPGAEPAYYARKIPTRTFNDRLSASGTLVVGAGGTPEDGAGNTLVGFFNARSLKEWRTPNTLAFRINGRGQGFHAHVEYATARWRAGGDFYGTRDPATGKRTARLVPGGAALHHWSLAYDPGGNGGGGAITATLDGETLVLNLDPGHRADGAAFDRFGILNVMKSADQGGTLWLGDLAINGTPEPLAVDPKWDALRNHATYTSANVRPRFDFGYSPTRHAGGQGQGECGGRFFRGDERYPERMAYYGDRLEPLNLDRPLKASGRVCMRRGVTDSTTLFGFFHSKGSMEHSTAQLMGTPENFLGAAIEGPSREGFLFYPLYGLDRDSTGASLRDLEHAPHLYPDGKPHDWTLEYQPAPDGGRITLSLDGRSTRLDLAPGHRAAGARFDRFGFITTHIDGNGQDVYLDDLTYTCR